MRYAGQSYELSVPSNRSLRASSSRASTPRTTSATATATRTRAVEIVTLRVKLVLPGVEVRETESEKCEKQAEDRARAVGQARSLVRRQAYARRRLRARRNCRRGDTFRGPAIVVQMDSTTAVPPDWRAEVDAAGNLVLEIA